MSYSKWVKRQSDCIVSDLRWYAARGIAGDLAVYVTPAVYPAWGFLTLANSKPEGATDILRFKYSGLGDSTRVGGIAYNHMHSAIYEACRNMPICGE